tara:strand:- start:8 stop:508 length:501 start_codon:yes stop_codon:yes gene_type:complete
MLEHLRMMARYNKWANAQLNTAVMNISHDAYMAEREAFFGSIHGGLNHILLVDRIWRGRVEGNPHPADRLDIIVTDSREAFLRERMAEDDILIDFTDSFDGKSLDEKVTYSSLIGFTGTDPRRLILAHMFNHATHHRGQIHALLTQVPADPPPLDLMVYIRETEAG